LTVTLTKDLVVAATFRSVAYTEDFESGGLKNLPWVTDSAVGWSVQGTVVSSGKFAAKAGAVSDGKSSSLSVSSFAGGGVGSFDVKVSSEPNWDQLEFYLNGVRLQAWSGEVAWTTFQFQIPSGNNTYEWRYTKDSANSVGADTAWIDNIQLRVRPAIDSTSKATVKFVGFQDGKGQVSVTGQVGQTYLVQVSTDFTSWGTIATKVNTSGTFAVTDTDANRGVRFYRAIVAP
jgi:hypothetical protein